MACNQKIKTFPKYNLTCIVSWDHLLCIQERQKLLDYKFAHVFQAARANL